MSQHRPQYRDKACMARARRNYLRISADFIVLAFQLTRPQVRRLGAGVAKQTNELNRIFFIH